MKRAFALVSFLAFCSWSGAATAGEAELLAKVQGHYRNQHFDRVFATVQWARAKHWTSWSVERRDHWLALEIMALARHCQWTSIDRLAETPEAAGVLSGKALALVRMKKEYIRFKQDPQNKPAGFVQEIVERKDLWRAVESDLARFDSPENIRVRVRSLCEK